jgi:hypothetical protein
METVSLVTELGKVVCCMESLLELVNFVALAL